MDKPALVLSLGALFDYLSRTQINGLQRMNELQLETEQTAMTLDLNARRNLEILENSAHKGEAGLPCSGCWTRPRPPWASG